MGQCGEAGTEVGYPLCQLRPKWFWIADRTNVVLLLWFSVLLVLVSVLWFQFYVFAFYVSR